MTFFLLEQLELPVVILLRQLELRLGPFGRCRCLVERGFQLRDFLLGLRQRRSLLIDDVLIWLRIDTEQHVAFLERRVGLHRHLGHTAFHRGKDRRHRKVDPGIFGEGMIIVHDQQNQTDAKDSAEHRGRQ
jgi:hypothetical protein